MIYLLYGKNKFLINEEINKIKNKENIDDINVVNYEFNNQIMHQVIEECNTVSLFSEKKLIIVNNVTIFNRVKNDEIDMDEIIDYINNFNKENILIFVNELETIDNTKKITKLIKEKGILKEFNDTDIKNIVKNMFGEYKISLNNINFIINRVGKDLDLLNCEIEKIKIYKYNDLEITKEDIIKLTSTNLDLSAFNFVDQITENNKEMALKIYNEMLLVNNDPTKIIPLLASKFRLIYQTMILKRMGYTFNQMMSLLEMKEYPIKLALQASYKTNEKKLLSILNDLADLDINIKTGIIDAKLGMQLFILNI